MRRLREPAQGGAYPFSVSAPAATARLQQQLPNALTVRALLVIPIFAALVLSSDGGRSWAAAILFGAAAVTDQIDGYLARRWRVESSFGKIADPLADRLLIDTAVDPALERGPPAVGRAADSAA